VLPAACVQFLSVCHNFLTALPSGLSCLTALEELDVSLNTDMRELPTGLGQLANLTRLTASHMRLKQLPVDVGGLVSLVHLDVSHNSLHHLSAALSCLTGLTHLEASDNKLHQSAAVPEELASLTALRVSAAVACSKAWGAVLCAC
jgi:Leucine-rich repeat (LRR) protein